MMTKAASSLAMLLTLATAAYAQYPGHVENAKKKAPSVRAIAVLEWTGDMGKPSASRIIPISVFDGERYQPGGLYLAKPEPLALEPGMTVTAEIKTGQRRVISYVLSPFMRYRHEALRER